MQHATFDLETYSEAGIDTGLRTKKSGIGLVGAYVYAMHPSTRILMLSYDLHDGKGVRTWLPGCPDPAEFLDWIAAGNLVEAHNSKFEFWVWNKCTPMHWPRLNVEQTTCSMAKAFISGLPGAMGNLSKVLPLKTGGKLTTGTDLIKKFSLPNGPKVKHGDYENFVAYNRQDVVTEAEISMLCEEMSAQEREVWLMDHRMNDRGVPIDSEGLALCEQVYEEALAAGSARLQELTNGAVASVRETAKLGKWLEAQGERLPRTQKGNISITKDGLEPIYRSTTNPVVKEVLELRQELSLASVDKMVSMRAMLADDNRIRGILTYYGATHTGRWTSGGPQFQNLPAKGSEADTEATLQAFRTGKLPEKPVQVISGVLRGLIRAPAGKDLICSDYSAIEARVLAELAMEKWRQDVFRTHGKIYEMSASKITKIPFQEFEDCERDHKDTDGKKHPMRKLGKVAELASGYGGWINAWKRFGAENYFQSDQDIKDSILAWRRESPAIVNLWGGQIRRGTGGFNDVWPELFGAEGAVVNALLHPKLTMNVNKYISYMFDPDKNILFCNLPSGRKQAYREPRLIPTVAAMTGIPVYRIVYKAWSWTPIGWIDHDLYGGLLTNNFTQGTARDIMANAMCNCEKTGYLPILPVHDEVLAEVAEGFGSVEEMERVMSTMPYWCADWPIMAKGGWRGKRFRKG